ncbi:MAG TPA: polymer-forming cytoskeletal protein [Gammaproteobacteria bacterium]|nr:polymer-forming cytoskeletal protein [Gammaproteobacteria bacterium]
MATIGRSIHVDGDIRGDEDLLVEGEVSGTISLKSHGVTIGESAKVYADVYARSAYIDGFVEGDVYATERLTVRKAGRVRGNLTAPRVAIEEGAKFGGSIEMDPLALNFLRKKTRSLDEVQVVIDPGKATPEIVGRYLSELSVLYQMLGGSGIAFGPHSDPRPPITSSIRAESAVVQARAVRTSGG